MIRAAHILLDPGWSPSPSTNKQGREPVQKAKEDENRRELSCVDKDVI